MDKPRTIEDILAKVSEYLKEEKNLALIKDAYVVACEKHKDQMRKSGDHMFNIRLVSYCGRITYGSGYTGGIIA